MKSRHDDEMKQAYKQVNGNLPPLSRECAQKARVGQRSVQEHEGNDQRQVTHDDGARVPRLSQTQRSGSGDTTLQSPFPQRAGRGRPQLPNAIVGSTVAADRDNT